MPKHLQTIAAALKTNRTPWNVPFQRQHQRRRFLQAGGNDVLAATIRLGELDFDDSRIAGPGRAGAREALGVLNGDLGCFKLKILGLRRTAGGQHESRANR